MGRTNYNKYRSVSSFKDIRREKEILLLRGKILDARISLDFLEFKKSTTPSAIITSMAKRYLLPEVAVILNNLVNSRKD
ncbi:MAG TPA: hypothetical protein VJ963_01065 [Bacteroidales bacterium]|nr:hypothetical protein [Bacteroidales bacterium]